MALMSQTRAGFFNLAGQTFAVGDHGLRQIVTVTSLTKVPRSHPSLMGFFAMRGDILPLIDLHIILGLSPLSNRPTDVAIQIDYQGQAVALSVDEVLGFSFYEPSDETFDEHQAFALARIKHNRGQAILLDASRLIETFLGNLVVA
jgi:chemotaxis signal transduction protein